jgi:hypothetical protein
VAQKDEMIDNSDDFIGGDVIGKLGKAKFRQHWGSSGCPQRPRSPRFQECERWQQTMCAGTKLKRCVKKRRQIRSGLGELVEVAAASPPPFDELKANQAEQKQAIVVLKA